MEIFCYRYITQHFLYVHILFTSHSVGISYVADTRIALYIIEKNPTWDKRLGTECLVWIQYCLIAHSNNVDKIICLTKHSVYLLSIMTYLINQWMLIALLIFLKKLIFLKRLYNQSYTSSLCQRQNPRCPLMFKS